MTRKSAVSSHFKQPQPETNLLIRLEGVVCLSAWDPPPAVATLPLGFELLKRDREGTATRLVIPRRG